MRPRPHVEIADPDVFVEERDGSVRKTLGCRACHVELGRDSVCWIDAKGETYCDRDGLAIIARECHLRREVVVA